MEVLWIVILLVCLFAGILSGVSVIFAIAGVPLLVAVVASMFGAFDLSFLGAYPQRVIGIMNNPLLLAIPLFILMGNLLEQSRQAERMLVNIAKILGQSRSALALAVIFVSTLIAASTGIIGATIVMLGMISLPALLNAGVPERTSCGLICATGTLGQIIPPSIVLILLGDQISNAYIEAQQNIGNFAPDPVSVGDLFAGALIPGFILVALYSGYVLIVLGLNRTEEKALRTNPIEKLGGREIGLLVLGIIPPALLIIAVLGSILIGVATPTEAAAIGVAGTVLIAAASITDAPRTLKLLVIGTSLLIVASVMAQRFGISRIDYATGAMQIDAGNLASIAIALLALAGLLIACWSLWTSGGLKTALISTSQISAMVFGIIIAASMLSLVFRGFGGDKLVEEVLTNLPGGKWNLLLVTMVVIFLLGFVLDFVEIILIVIPIVGPVILQSDIHPVWFAILLALNIQTSFLTPPFGFALFYFRSVAPAHIKTQEIYKSIVPYVLLQLVAIGVVVAFPATATWLPTVLFGP